MRWASVRSLHERFPGENGIAQCRTVLRSDPEPMQRSPAGTTAATAGGRPSQPAEDLRREKRCRTSMPRIAQPLPAQCRGHRRRSKSGRSFCRHRAVDVLARGRMLVGREAVGRFPSGTWDPFLGLGRRWEISSRDQRRETLLKAACMQAATTLIATRYSVKGVVNVDQPRHFIAASPW